MASDHPQMWNLSGLVAAFLDLWIAYILLCASALVYLISKFMGFFRLRLSCPCNGLFCNIRNRNLCFNRLLVDIPTLKVTDVQLSVKQKFPFCGSANKDQRTGADTFENGVEYDPSCSSSADLDLRVMEKYDMKGKIGSRSRLSFLRKGGLVEGKHSVIPSLDLESASRIDRNGHGADYPECAETSDSVCYSSDDESHKKHKSEPQIDNPGDTGCCNGDEIAALRLLEQELDAERRAHAALYAELEKERSAAASAADEAMAMILRLQEEKASIYMEARQLQRIVEEKYAYDAEEISILKEIVVRREKEKHALEKEVEAYRKMAFAEDGDGFDSTDDGRISRPSFDPISFLHDIVASPNNKDPWLSSNRRDFDGKSEGLSSCNSELHEKEIISVSNPIQQISERLEECSLAEAEELEQIQDEMSEKIIETCTGSLCSYPSLKPAEICDLSSHFSRENSEIVHGLPSLDRKMTEIHGELGLLQERLNLIQKGKERLCAHGDTQDWDTNPIPSKDNVIPFRAIRPVIEPHQSVRQQSLPPPHTQAYSRKRRSRSAFSELQRITKE